MNRARLFLSSALALLLVGCPWNDRAPLIEDPLPIICETWAKPDALNLKDTPPTLVQNKAGAWGFWFSPDDYADLAENIQAMARWMGQSKAIRNKLVECIESRGADASPETK